MKRMAMVLATGLLALFGMSVATGAASALPYAPAPTLSIFGCSDVDNGIVVQVAGLLPGSSVAISLPGKSTSTTANTSGSASVTLLPSSPGDYIVTATGPDADGTAWTGTAAVTVVESCVVTEAVVDAVQAVDSAEAVDTVQTATTSALPQTGGNSGILLALGAGAILFGGAAVVAARTRRLGDSNQS